MLPLTPAPPQSSPLPSYPVLTPALTQHPGLHTSLSREIPAIKSGGKEPSPGPGGQPSPAGPPWLLPL